MGCDVFVRTAGGAGPLCVRCSRICLELYADCTVHTAAVFFPANPCKGFRTLFGEFIPGAGVGPFRTLGAQSRSGGRHFFSTGKLRRAASPGN
eukprot:4092118-Pyramimonas_sp.AAC.1